MQNLFFGREPPRKQWEGFSKAYVSKRKHRQGCFPALGNPILSSVTHRFSSERCSIRQRKNMKNQTCLGSFPHSFGNTSLQGFTLLWVNYLPKIARHFRNVKIGEFFSDCYLLYPSPELAVNRVKGSPKQTQNLANWVRLGPMGTAIIEGNWFNLGCHPLKNGHIGLP